MSATDKIIKDASILRAYLKSGKVDINQLDAFLGRVEQLAAPGTGKVRSRVQRQMMGFRDKKFTAYGQTF